MHSFLQRLNALFFFSLSVLALMAFLSAFSAKYMVASPSFTIQTFKVTNNRRISFQFDGDLSSLFNWNVKQLFVYVTVEYTTPLNEFNQVTLWDDIIRHPENAVFKKRVFNEYALWDQHVDLRGTTMNVTLSWDVIPVVGTLRTDSQTVGSFVFQPSQ